jgi:uncharacterized membrane protein
MNKTTTIISAIVAAIGSLGIGAGLMYFLDPERGNRRRALVQGQVNRSTRRLGGSLNQAVGNMRGRTQAMMNQTRMAVMGQATNSRIPMALRGLLAAGGGSLAYYGRNRKNMLGTAASLAGLTMVAGGVASIPIRRMIRKNREQEGIEVEKTIEIDAPVEEVYRFWTDYTNLPRFLSHVRDVQALEGGKAHWRAGEPLETELVWDTITTSQVPNELISWRSIGDAPVKSSGQVRLKRAGDDRTRVSLRLAYSAAGELSRKTASLLGEYPLQQLDEDLVRMKKLIEAQNSRHRMEQEAEMPLAM